MLKLLRDGDVINFIGHNLDGTNRMITVFEELDKLDITPLIHELSELFKKLVIFTREKRFLGIKSLENNFINKSEDFRDKYGRSGIAIRFNNDIYNKIARFNDRNIKSILLVLRNNMLVPFADKDLTRSFKSDRILVKNIHLSDNKRAVEVERNRLCQELVDSSVNALESPDLDKFVFGSLDERKQLFENYIDRMILTTMSVLNL